MNINMKEKVLFVPLWMSFRDMNEPYADECTLILNPDGTAYFSVDGEAGATSNWEETGKGIKLLGDAKMTFNEDGDALTTKVSGVTLRFELQ